MPRTVPAGARAPATVSPSAVPSGSPSSSPSANPSAGPTHTPVATPTATASSAAPVATSTPTPSPTPFTSASFNDWPTYQFDTQRSGFNPNTTRLTSGVIGTQLHLAWHSSIGDYNTQTQPIVITGVPGHRALLIVGGGTGNVQAYDGTTGSRVWGPVFLGQQTYTCGGSTSYFGVGGTAAYDPSSRTIYISADSNTMLGGPTRVLVYQIDAATGTVLASGDAAPSPLPGELTIGHTSIALAGSTVYLGTGSSCDISSWRGRVTALDAHNLAAGPMQTFFTTYGQGGAFSGGGVWGWGGVSVDASGNVYAGSGNADTGSGASGPQPPFAQTGNEQAGYAERLIKLSAQLSVLDSNYPTFTFAPGLNDLDFGGSPILFTPSGCGQMASIMGKSGELYVYNANAIGSGPAARYQLSMGSSRGVYIGNPAFSPYLGELFAVVSSSQGGSLYPPGMIALSFAGCTPHIAWDAQFGPDDFNYGSAPRSAPTVTAGGLVLVGTPCTPGGGTCGVAGAQQGALWALDATTGNVLNGGTPVLITASSHIRMAPVADGDWIWVIDNQGQLYGLTIDPSYPAIPNAARRR